MVNLYKYSGAGNDFMIADGRVGDLGDLREPSRIVQICEENFTDGVIILTSSQSYDFGMEFYNPDGSTGMMCGNGGRCIVAFAASLGIEPGSGSDTFARLGIPPSVYLFEAADGLHTGEIISTPLHGLKTSEDKCYVRLKMKDVHTVERFVGLPEISSANGYFLDTGARHFVSFVPDARKVNLAKDGRAVRNSATFAPQGVNANFLSVDPDGSLRVRTFEKGVEGETLACGTGLVASAIAARHKGIAPYCHAGRRQRYVLHARQDDLLVDFVYLPKMDFRHHTTTYSAVDVYLIGPVEAL